VPDARGVGRRGLLLGVGAAAVLSACDAGPREPAPPGAGRQGGGPPGGGACRDAGARWPGHRPCRVYLGMSYPGDIAEAEAVTGPAGVHRSYYDWDDLAREAEVIGDDHAHRRLPWVSFKPPPSSSGAGWGRVADGAGDDDLRERARVYAGTGAPVVVTFHHEPTNDGGSSDEYAAAWARVHDVMRDETGLANVALVPIIGEWQFNPRNGDGEPSRWVTDDVLDRAAFLGVDLYQNDSGEAYPERLGRVLDWLGGRGRPDLMIGLGESGCSDRFGAPSAARWWRESWAWVEANADRVGVLAYFNSDRNSKPDVYWPLDESPAKLAAYRRALASPTACRLPA
jgi:hypothetical protein